MKRVLTNHKRPIIIAHQIKKEILRKGLNYQNGIGRRFRDLLRELLTL